MKNYKRTIRLITFLLIPFSFVRAQVHADFTMNQQNGCSPLAISFTNLSTGSGTLSYMWYLGAQQGTSVLKNPQATYIAPGTYSVKLVVDNSIDKDSVTKNIVVYKNPSANFSVERKGCTPHEAQFTDLSTLGDAPINLWEWDFRTGEIINDQNPVHTYTLPGKYDVFLQITDENGCTDHLDFPQCIDVVAPPVPNFSFSPTSACYVPASFQFTNLSTGSSVLSYSWDLGNSVTSTETNPSNTYTSFGNYDVNLIVSNDYGCSRDTTKTVYVNQVSASGILSQGGSTISNNDTICAGYVDFQSTSTGAGFVRWIFGDGQSSVSTSGFHNYTTSGSISVMLIASPGNQCADTVIWNFYIESVTADFTMDKDYSCNSSSLVDFTDHSDNAVGWEWFFQDGQKAYNPDVSHTYVVPAETDPYQINDNEYFITTLKVESPHGCNDSISKVFRIKKPTAIFTVDKTSGCYPLQVKFKDQSLSDEPVTTWEWIFGDSQTSSGTVDSALHTYNTDDSFDARLVITNDAGCKDTSYVIPVETGKKLLPDFTVSSYDVCPHELITFTNTTPESSLIDGWYYAVNGAGINNPPDEPDPSWYVMPATGDMDVELRVNYNGCISDTVKEDLIHNKGPLSDFDYSLDCKTPMQYSFTNQSAGFSTFKWVFGTGNTNTADLNPVYTYSAEGDSAVELIVYEGACSDTLRKTLNVRNVNAVINADTMVCVNQQVDFNGDQSFTLSENCYEKYLWNFNDSTPPVRTDNDIVHHIFTERGIYNVSLITNSDNGCTDTAYLNVRAYKPYAGFEADTLYGCTPFIVNFTDTTTSDVHSLESWTWKFNTGNDSIYYVQIPAISHWFNNPGVYNVTLTVTDTLGCAGEQVTAISTANPSAEFIVNDTNICLGEEVLFYNIPQEKDSVIWNFDDGFVSRDLSRPLGYTYPVQGEYTPSLIIYRFGCSDTFMMKANEMKVQLANAYFEVSDSIWNCYPREDTLTHIKNGQQIVSGQWNFGYGNNVSAYAETRIFNYPSPGVYTPSLRILTSFGCADTFSRNITLHGPTGNFTMSPDAACRGDEITFALTDTTGVGDFHWDMGDGNLQNGNPLVYSYTNMGVTYPKLVLSSDSGSCIVALADTLTIYMAQADFELPDTALCENSNIRFTNTSQGNDHNTWHFSNGEFSIQDEPEVVFTSGDFQAELIVRNDFGCSDTLEKSFTISPLPLITLMTDTVVCRGNTVNLRVSGGDEALWVPSAGLSANNVFMPLASPDSSITYTVFIKDTATGCRNSDEMHLLVQQSPNINISPNDTGLFVGEVLTMSADSLGELTYNWSPDYMINCTNCAAPQVQPLTNTTYVLTIADTNHCFTESYNVIINVTEDYTVALPTAFTPASNDENSVVYVKGHGIKRLIEFRIYNRWGNEVFYTDDINHGWDGTYNGKLLNIDTYTYVVSAEWWDGKVTTTKGTITLLR